MKKSPGLPHAVIDGASHVTPADGNIFSDLGFSDDEAAALKQQSDEIISEKRRIKESLMTEIAGWITENQLKQSDAARILGVTRPRVSDVIHKKTVKFTIDALVDMLARSGRRVQIAIWPLDRTAPPPGQPR